MFYPIKEIEYKINLINDKTLNNIELSEYEKEYLNKFNKFMEIYNVLSLEYEINSMDLDIDGVNTFLNNKIKKIQTKIDSNKDDISKAGKTIDIIESFQKYGIKYFREYLINNFKFDKVDINKFIEDFILSDYFLSSPSLEIKTNPFYYLDSYTGELRLNSPLIEVTKQVILGNFKNYNSIEKFERLSIKKPEKIRELEDDLLPFYRKCKTTEISRILNFIKLDKDNPNFVTTIDNLEFLSSIAYIFNGASKRIHSKEIQDYILQTLNNILSGEINFTMFKKYEVLDYFKYYYKKTFRDMLVRFSYDLDKIVTFVLKDDLLSSTNIEGDINLLIDKDNNLNTSNICLLTSFINEIDAYYDDTIYADYSTLNKATKLLSNVIDVHKYDKDKYDAKVLEAIAKYKQDKEKKNTKDNGDIDKSSLL